MGGSCLILVWACELIGQNQYSVFGFENLRGLDLPISIIAVIIAAAATSVPDTILSVKDALKGNYNDAISNAIGSNVFDIGFALGFPVLMFSILYSMWQFDVVTDTQQPPTFLPILSISIYLYGYFCVCFKKFTG